MNLQCVESLFENQYAFASMKASFYNHFPNIENFKKQIEEKNSNFNDKREILASELEKQYLNFDVSDATSNNIELLKDSKTFTVTTGHQLNLFTGPLYFLYNGITKIIRTG